jgi:hypothetical protein
MARPKDRETFKQEAERPVEEAGGGEAEGFEQAEERLIEEASHGDSSADPLADRMPLEPDGERVDEHNAHGEADDVETPDRPDRA